MRAIDYYELERYCIDRGLTCVPVEVIKSMADVEAEPVRYGHWITFLDGEDDGIFCSECKEDLLKLFPCVDEDRLPKRCPHCGAKMRKDDEDDD